MQIAKETNDTSKVKLLIKLGRIFSTSESEKRACLKEAYEISMKHNYRYGMAYGKYYEGFLLSLDGKYDEAIKKYKRSIDELDSMYIVQHLDGFPLYDIAQLYNKSGKQIEKFKYFSEKVVYYKLHGPKENLADCYRAIGSFYIYTSDFDKAIEYLMRAWEVYKSFDSLGNIYAKQVIGTVYYKWGNPDKAEEFLESAMNDLAHVSPELFDFTHCYNMLGSLHFAKGDLKRALQFYLEGRKYAVSSELQIENLVNCAHAYLQMGSLDSAEIYLERATYTWQSEPSQRRISHADLNFGYYTYHVALGNKKFAYKYIKDALEGARSVKFSPAVLVYLQEIHSFLLEEGDSLQAYRYLAQYNDMKDSLDMVKREVRTATYEIEQQTQMKEDEILQLKTQKATQRNYYIITGVFLMLILLGGLSRYRYKRRRDQEQLTTEFKKQLAQAEIKALRSQMNPHFIFNSLNSINSFVMDQKHEIASDYLIKFSKLIRLILDNSRSETISIEKELETLKLYVILESARFDNKFKCVYNISDDLNTNSIMIPPMLLQPFVENAIWHGLMQKEGEGTITIEIKKADEEFLNISITDDGIGREKAAELKSKSATHKSHGLKVTSQRIEMMNKLNSTGAQVLIFDLKDDKGHAAGTKVELIIPY